MINETIIIKDEGEARSLWEKFGDSNTIYDSWPFRARFAKSEQASPYFIVATFEDGEIGVLPLQWNPTRNRYEFFGGVYMEESSPLPRSLSSARKKSLYDAAPAPVFLGDITSNNNEVEGLTFEEFKYTTHLKDIANAEDYLEKRFSGKTRGGFRKRIRQVKEKGVVVESGTKTDLDILFEFNVKNFGHDSSFSSQERREIFYDLTNPPFQSDILVFRLEGTVGAVSLGLRFKDWYVYMNAGVDKERFPNLGTFVILSNIQNAINQGCLYFDAGVEDLGWKERWHLDCTPQYKLER